jgi:hypothetical protein
MRDPGGDRDDPKQPPAPAGRRWGCGALSVLPYLAKALQARPAANENREARNSRNPSFKDSTRPGSAS